MSVVAWDGRILAADRRGINGSLLFSTTKLRRIHTGEVLAWTGTHAFGEMLAQWYVLGADPATWPECQKGDDWTRLIVACPQEKRVFTYEQMPVRSLVESVPFAWGCGRDFALMAMHLGKSAVDAVELTALFDHNCGNGVDFEEVWP